MNRHTHAWHNLRRLLSMVVVMNMLAALLPIGFVSAAEEGTAAMTGGQVVIYETVTNGFTHPGIGLTKEILENMRTQVLAQKEPWFSYYKAMTQSAAAAKTVTSSNESAADPTKPAVDTFNSTSVQSRFIADGLKAYTQALMYVITADEIYRANAMHIIRIWSQMDPAKYAYYTDAHIHAGFPLNRMATAAEILRYTSYQTPALAWTEADTANFMNHLINPVIQTFQSDNNWFMNQNNYALLGAMAGYIFTDNQEGYDQRVEWFTVNKSAQDQGFNGSIKQLFRLIDTNAATGEKLGAPVVQHVEMGRDQAHGAGDLVNAAVISRMMLAQGTKVDPAAGTVSTNENAVGPYEFLDDRILKAADYFWQYMLGYDTPWVPVPYAISPDGTVRGIYHRLSDLYRGRTTTALFWDLYYYYAYERGVNVAEQAPYFYEAFEKRTPSNYYYKGALAQAWESVDGGGDFWLYIPQEAESEGAQYVPKEQTDAALVQIEERYTALDGNSSLRREGDTDYVEFQPNGDGSRIAVQNLSFADRSNARVIGLRFRTNGAAVLTLSKEAESAPYHSLSLPDTKGQWQYITFDMGINHVSYGQLDNDYSLVYMKVQGESGTVVDVDHFHVQAGTQLTPPVFTGGNADLTVPAYIGAPVTLDFSATDANASEVLKYRITNQPDGAQLDENSGVFYWQPAQAGTYSFIAEANDGTTSVTKKVDMIVTEDRTAAITAAMANYDPDADYVSASLDTFTAAHEATLSQVQFASDAAFYEQLLMLKREADQLQLLTPLLSDDGSIDYSSLVDASTLGTSISHLVDGNSNSYAVYSLAPYPNLYHTVDFGPNFKVSADAFAMQGRMNFTDRMAGSAVFGSNDGIHWTRLTPEESAFSDDLVTLAVDEAHRDERYRLFKVEMIHPQPDVLHNKIQNLLELSEFRIYGERYEVGNKLESVSIRSDQSVNGRIVLGDTVRLTVKAKEAIQDVAVTIQGHPAAVSTQDQLNWIATVTLNPGTATGAITFSVDYKTRDGHSGDTAYFTTDRSKLFLSNESDLIDNVTGLANLIDSTAGRTPAQTLQQVNYLFDGNASTASDFRLNGSGAGSYITFDFKEGKPAGAYRRRIAGQTRQ